MIETATAEKIPNFAAMREEAMIQFAKDHGWDATDRKLLVDQASFRRYYRLTQGNETIVLLDSPNPNAPQEKLPNVVAYSNILNEIGLRAPKVIAVDLTQGFALLEDFGDNVYSSLFDQGADKGEYLKLGMDTLIHLHTHLDPSTMPQLGNSLEYYLSENPHFTNWYWSARNNHETPPDLAAEYLGLWKNLLQGLPPIMQTMSMTDYHAPNLMALNDGKGIQSVGIIDFQDSVLSSPVYDVMSLLEDDRRDLDDSIGLALRAYYRNAMKDKIDPELFDLYYAVHSAQRHAKNMGNFVRIAVQKNSPIWLSYIPVATKWFDRALHSHDYLAPMQKWFAKHSADYNQPLENIRYFLK
jgi:N-acetylmuramate 1-kinase